MQCLQCERVFPDRMQGEVEPGGMMLCLGCGHVMAWTDELTLRELTEKEHVEAGTNQPLMRERLKVIPRKNTHQYPGSWMLTGLMCLIIVMVALERLGFVHVLHH